MIPLSTDISAKLDLLREAISRCCGAAVAFSGGVDSTFLLSIARDVLEKRLLAVTLVSPVFPPSEMERAREITRLLGVEHEVIEADVLELEAVRRNRLDRCYHCKMLILSKIVELAGRRGFPCVMEASNADDARDYRPGTRAVEELGVVSPLAAAAITKEEIRALSRERGLPTWDSPAMACLASRIPYGEPVTVEKLDQVRRGEEILAGAGFRNYRLRHHGSLARIEVPPGEMGRLIEPDLRRRIVEQIKGLGFAYVAFDLEGYRSGSMNEVLDL